MRVLIPIAGPYDAFKEKGYLYSKNLIEVQGKPLIQHVYEKLQLLPEAKFIFIVNREEIERFHIDNVLKLLSPSCTIFTAENTTAGAACTALLAIEEIENNEPLLIVNGDQIIEHNIAEIIEVFNRRALDGGIITFDSVHPRWSYVKVDEQGYVVEAAEKRPISRMATAGFYYFKHGYDFAQSAMETIRKDARVDGKFYICPCYNEMVLKQQKIGIFTIPRSEYFSLASPQGVEEYEKHVKPISGGNHAG